MSCIITNHELTLVGGLGVVFILLAAWMALTSGPPRTNLPEGFKGAVLALELSGNKEAVRQIVDTETSGYREPLRDSIRKDFVFIFSYAAFFVALSLLLSQTNTSVAKWLGPIAAILAVSAAAFDFVENYRMLQVLSTEKENITDVACMGIRNASLLKWALLFLSVLLQAIVLLQLKHIYLLLGIVMTASAIGGIAGLRYYKLIPLAMLGLGVCVIALVIILLVTPSRFLRAVC